MTKTELEVIGRLLGRRSGPILACPQGSIRDVYPSRVFDVCKRLEAEGIGKISKIDNIAFTFTTHAALQVKEG